MKVTMALSALDWYHLPAKVLVCYGGLDHTRNVAKFFQYKLGFSSRGLRNGGRVGKEEHLGS